MKKWYARMICYAPDSCEVRLIYDNAEDLPWSWGLEEENVAIDFARGEEEVYIDVYAEVDDDGKIKAYTSGMEGFDTGSR